jgi:phosphoribosylformimino-5-aminoimidazole carboxamide ribotide isomerase
VSQRGASTFEILPAIDLRGGHVVRLSQGDFTREQAYSDDPAAVARSFADAGAEWIHVVDLDGALGGERRQADVVASIVAAVAPDGVHVQVAGGLRDREAVDAALAAGAARIVLGTAAITDQTLVTELVARHGPERIAVALDVRDGLAVGTGWVPGAPAMPLESALANLDDARVETVVVTAIERDGLLRGPDLALLRQAVTATRATVIASAGIASLDDIAAVRRIGCRGAIIGRAIYDGRIDLRAAISAATRPAGPPTSR